MSGFKNREFSNRTYCSIFRNKFFIKSDDTSDPNYNSIEYTVRAGEDKGKVKIKAGIFHDSLEGRIKSIRTKDSDYGKRLEVVVLAGIEEVIIDLSIESVHAQQIISKLSNKDLDLTKEVTFAPYDFVPKGGAKVLSGVTVLQGEVKFENGFITGKDNNGRPTGYLHNFPPMDGEMDEDEYKIYKIKIKKFLINWTDETLSKAVYLSWNTTPQQTEDDYSPDMPDGGDDLPF